MTEDQIKASRLIAKKINKEGVQALIDADPSDPKSRAAAISRYETFRGLASPFEVPLLGGNEQTNNKETLEI